VICNSLSFPDLLTLNNEHGEVIEFDSEAQAI